MDNLVSVSPDGTVYSMPDEADHRAEPARMEVLVSEARAKGQEIVVVMGVGFVGAVMAAIIADTTDSEGSPPSLQSACKGRAQGATGGYPCSTRGSRPSKRKTPKSTR